MPEQYKNIANNEQLIQIPDIDVIYGHFNQPMAITDKYSLWPLGEPRLSCTVPAVWPSLSEQVASSSDCIWVVSAAVSEKRQAQNSEVGGMGNCAA